jgi:hypothetical protein
MDLTRSSQEPFHTDSRLVSSSKSSSSGQQSCPPSAPPSHHIQPSLLSVYHLDPPLPPSNISQHLPSPGDISTYNDPLAQPAHAASSSGIEMPSLPISLQLPPTDCLPVGDLDPYDDNLPGPPKKPKLRQASTCDG